MSLTPNAEILQELCTTLTDQEIADKYSVHRITVRRWRLKENISTHTGGLDAKQPDTRQCRYCNKTKPLAEMDTLTKNDVVYYRTRCLLCVAKRVADRASANPEQEILHIKKACARAQAKRKDPTKQAYLIYTDSRGTDTKKNRENDLDQNFIQETIKNGCSYCGETELRMTLDRIDNDLGHLKSNVIPACIRCNYTRKDMPYEAWLIVAPGMRAAREAGMFNEWTGRARKTSNLPTTLT